MRYKVFAIEAGRAAEGSRCLGEFSEISSAREKAEELAWDYYYGTAILDRETGLVDYGECGFEPEITY